MAKGFYLKILLLFTMLVVPCCEQCHAQDKSDSGDTPLLMQVEAREKFAEEERQAQGEEASNQDKYMQNKEEGRIWEMNQEDLLKTEEEDYNIGPYGGQY